jgi:predicted DNA-binding protein (MmcQ/YjbR family)
MAHAVGLDPLASVEAILSDFAENGFETGHVDSALAEALLGETLTWSLAEYKSALTTLPQALQEDLATAWGAPEDDPTVAGDAFTFKAGEIAFEVLQERPGVRPAPYLASRGMKWLQHFEEPGLTDTELREYITLSYQMVTAGLSKRKRAELGIPDF